MTNTPKIARSLLLAALALGTGCVTSSRAHHECPEPGQEPFPEVCNAFDDDCDGTIDEGVCDDDCDAKW